MKDSGITKNTHKIHGALKKREKGKAFTEITASLSPGLSLTLILIIGAVISWTLSGCNSKELNAWHQGAVDGIVRDANGTPLPDVLVSATFLEEKTRTDSRGYFFLTGLDVGENTLMAERDGYTSDARQILVEGNKTLEGSDLLLIKLPVWQAEKLITTREYLDNFSIALSDDAAKRFQ
ncbi:MAG: hypothetical protein CVV64_01505 [Candidatus Wallbacteria bacterium HGW-Wallbacteria-1]|jgi:hypothetical protein|uniref:Carboxypeptidase regulatory-like domain-containing protein n=1 Tax=Candidatus Wallbacteria bacterium HGW-Wallbacteria-1 TaxID=2013854 RepID=A0A2N1PUZ1_9BACT|nr:MAG: hypothetical protein CVV64_01505 [Candidatus Wallbacteria bacterium HGW-Wallbacteria-1]